MSKGIGQVLAEGGYDKSLARLYTGDGLTAQKARLLEVWEAFAGQFGGEREARVFSAPGRSELSGNHTDHQLGRVLAAGIDLDVLCVAAANGGDRIRIQSKGYNMDEIDLSIMEPQAAETNHSASLIRGIAARCRELGYEVGGFDAYTVSNVLKGSGLSSSAAFEIAVVTMINHLFNQGRISAIEAAQIGQYAENVFFGKPSGLMDQMASSVSGIVYIDFQTPERPLVEPLLFDLSQHGHSLCVVDTGGSHADLTHEYASIPAEMGKVAQAFGKRTLREVDADAFYGKIAETRAVCGDRAVLRAIHFFGENARVAQQADALRKGDFARFLALVRESGRSSFEFLQNVYPSSAPQEQGVSLALAVSERILGDQGACRVHGGGFGGTILAFVPDALVEEYRARMDAVFGEGACLRLRIRPAGGVEILPDRSL